MFKAEVVSLRTPPPTPKVAALLENSSFDKFPKL